MGKGRKVGDQNISGYIFFSHLHPKAFNWMFMSDLEFSLKEPSGVLSLSSLQLFGHEFLIVATSEIS